MDENEKKFPEQNAPLKNTDDAFVQVNKDGSPVMPNSKKKTDEEQDADRRTVTDNR